MEKNKMTLKLVIAGIILFVICVGIAFFWYKIFLRDKSEVVTFEISLSDIGEGVNIENMVPMTDKKAQELPSHTFKVSNNGKIKGSYEVLIEDSVVYDDAGTMINDPLKRNQLKYELKLNDKVIAKDLLSNLKNDVLDTRTIAANSTNQYELRIWVPTSAVDWENKIYHYNIAINSIMEEE